MSEIGCVRTSWGLAFAPSSFNQVCFLPRWFVANGRYIPVFVKEEIVEVLFNGCRDVATLLPELDVVSELAQYLLFSHISFIARAAQF